MLFIVGSLPCLAALAAYGADFDQVDLKNKLEGSNGGNTPLHFAAQGHGMCCRFLVQRGKISCSDNCMQQLLALMRFAMTNNFFWGLLQLWLYLVNYNSTMCP